MIGYIDKTDNNKLIFITNWTIINGDMKKLVKNNVKNLIYYDVEYNCNKSIDLNVSLYEC